MTLSLMKMTLFTDDSVAYIMAPNGFQLSVDNDFLRLLQICVFTLSDWLAKVSPFS